MQTGLWWLLRRGPAESGGRFFLCDGATGRNPASVAVKMFSRLIYLIKKFYKFFPFGRICENNNAAINCVILQQGKGLTLFNSDGLYTSIKISAFSSGMSRVTEVLASLYEKIILQTIQIQKTVCPVCFQLQQRLIKNSKRTYNIKCSSHRVRFSSKILSIWFIVDEIFS
jgi:hypothetical protein